MKQKLVEIIGNDAKKGDIVELSLPAKVYTCMPHCGVDNIAGYFEKFEDDKVHLSILIPDGLILSFPRDDIEAYEILPEKEKCPVEDLEKSLRSFDLVLVELASGETRLAYNMCVLDGEEMRLAYSRKAGYECDVPMQTVDIPLKDIVSYQLLSKWVPNINDEIDRLIVGQMQDWDEQVDLPEDWPKHE